MKKLHKFDSFNENMLPKNPKTTECLECGVKVVDSINDKLWHLYDKHFKKSTVGEWEEEEMIKKFFPKTGSI